MPGCIDLYTRYPATVELLAPQLKSTEWAVAVKPDPERDTNAGEFGPLLTKDTEPLALPAVCGANVIEAVALAPTAIDFGNVIPLTLNPLPLILAADTVRLELPLFVNVTV